mmetsp:Transcript_19076/g.57237  ORF Transcript_19076/g.57237 Transcript_19076/m.57237 type:complete len:344 (+) Transcript_19076:605-1636(+)
MQLVDLPVRVRHLLRVPLRLAVDGLLDRLHSVRRLPELLREGPRGLHLPGALRQRDDLLVVGGLDVVHVLLVRSKGALHALHAVHQRLGLQLVGRLLGGEARHGLAQVAQGGALLLVDPQARRQVLHLRLQLVHRPGPGGRQRRPRLVTEAVGILAAGHNLTGHLRGHLLDGQLHAVEALVHGGDHDARLGVAGQVARDGAHVPRVGVLDLLQLLGLLLERVPEVALQAVVAGREIRLEAAQRPTELLQGALGAEGVRLVLVGELPESLLHLLHGAAVAGVLRPQLIEVALVLLAEGLEPLEPLAVRLGGVVHHGLELLDAPLRAQGVQRLLQVRPLPPLSVL